MFRRSLKSLRAWVNRARIALLRASGVDNILIVSADTRSAATQRIAGLLPFYSVGGAVPLPALRVVPSHSRWQTLTARAVLLAETPATTPSKNRMLTHVFDLDRHNPMEGWEWCRLHQHLAGLPTVARQREAHRRLRSAIDHVRSRQPKRVYAFGTGPSLARAAERRFDDGTVIVCNTIVRDRSLWHHLNPDFVVAGDAIYHFGHTAHARAFRADLHARLQEAGNRTLFVYPELFDAIVSREMADVAHLLVPVPFGAHQDIAVNLSNRFELPALGNVLNILLLPLACSISRDVNLWGFDGRAPTDKLFWSNSSPHSYPEFMQALRDEHPGFFSHHVPVNNESKYVESVHGDLLDQLMTDAERRGFRFTMLHESWTPTLRKRMIAAGTAADATPPSDLLRVTGRDA